MQRLRRFTLREKLRERQAAVRAAIFVYASLAWPWGAAWETSKNVLLLRKRPVPASTWVRMYWYALVHQVPPVEYVAYGFDDPVRSSQWAQYLYWQDGPALRRLNRLRGADERDVQDKRRFMELCRHHGIAHVDDFDLTQPLALAHGERLWSKPRWLSTGQGAAAWQVLGRCVQNVTTGETFDESAFRRHLRDAAKLLQPALRNHPSLEGLTNGWLATLRLISLHHSDGRVTLLKALLTLPQGRHITTNSGVACTVDMRSGRLGRSALRGAPLARHPDTQQALEGRPLPQWQEALALVRQAHASAFPRFASLAWDLAFTPAGPVLLEANAGWGTFTFQQMFGPLGLTEFASLVEEMHLEGLCG